MSTFSIALFLHITGAFGVFVALGLEWTALRQIGSATQAGQVRPWLGMLRSSGALGFPSMLAAVITGVYMVLTAFGWVTWILVVLGALVLMIGLSTLLTRPRMAAIGLALPAEKGPISQAFHDLANQPAIWISIQTRVALALGIVFLKIARPDLVGSLIVIGIAILAGIASALPVARSVRTRGASAG